MFFDMSRSHNEEMRFHLLQNEKMRKIFIYSLWFTLVTASFLMSEPFACAQTSTYYRQKKRGKRVTGKITAPVNMKKSASLDLIYTGDFFTNARGGYEQHSDYCYALDLIISGTLESFPWGRNATYGFDFIGVEGVNPSDTVGDFQGISNIAAQQTWKPYETWFQFDILKERLSFLLGMFDINSEFYVNETAAIFLNSAFALGSEFAQSESNGVPTFPNPGLGLRLKTRLSDSISLKTAIMDGDTNTPDKTWNQYYRLDRNEGALLSMEISFTSHEEKLKTVAPSSKRFQRRRNRMRTDHLMNTFNRFGRGRQKDRSSLMEVPKGRYSKLTLGSWYYTAEFNNLVEKNTATNKIQRGNWGVYSTGEKMLWQDAGNPIQAVSIFFHAGISDKDVNKVDMSFAGGFVYSGIFIKHFQNQIGCGLTAAHISDGFQTALMDIGEKTDDWEIAAEITYRTQVNKTLSFQPDIQYIFDPGFNPGLENALVCGIRFEIAF
jgi:porin